MFYLKKQNNNDHINNVRVHNTCINTLGQKVTFKCTHFLIQNRITLVKTFFYTQNDKNHNMYNST